MNGIRRVTTLSLLVLVVGGCANQDLKGFSEGGAPSLDDTIDRKLQALCPIDENIDEMRAIRAQLILSAVAGYGARSVNSYSAATDVRDDASRTLQRVQDAGQKLKNIAGPGCDAAFPLNRADVLVAIANAAEAAVRPTLHAIPSLATALPLDRVRKARTILVNLLEDQVYLEAIADTCKRANAELSVSPAVANGSCKAVEDRDKLKKVQRSIDARLDLRCKELSQLAGTNGSHQCVQLWP